MILGLLKTGSRRLRTLLLGLNTRPNSRTSSRIQMNIKINMHRILVIVHRPITNFRRIHMSSLHHLTIHLMTGRRRLMLTNHRPTLMRLTPRIINSNLHRTQHPNFNHPPNNNLNRLPSLTNGLPFLGIIIHSRLLNLRYRLSNLNLITTILRTILTGLLSLLSSLFSFRNRGLLCKEN